MSAAEAPPADPTRPVRPRRRVGELLHRILHPHPVVLETRRPVEVAVLTETKRRWEHGERAGAVGYAYAATLADLERAFGVRFPPDWTHEDILERGVTKEMGSIPEFLELLLAAYEPIRYGRELSMSTPSPVPLVESIYAHPAMWGLYVAAVPRPDLDGRALRRHPEAPQPMPPSEAPP